ncbi:lysostaphin resistance A-like protein [Actinocorallia lasiicapitis]
MLGLFALVGMALVAVIGVMLGWMLLHVAISGKAVRFDDAGAPIMGSTEDLALNLTLLAVLTPIVLFVTWAVGRRPAGTVISVVGRMRWKWLAVCALLGVGFVVVSYALNLLVGLVVEPDATGETFVGWERFLGPALMIVLLVPFQSAAEEFVFRGWLMQAIGSYWKLATPLPAMIVSSAVFVLGHGYTGWAMLDIFCFAMIAAWLVIKTGGLEASIALHVLNNLMAFLLPAAIGELGSSLEQGGAPWWVLLIDVPPLALYAAAVLWLAKRRRIATVTPQPEPAATPVPERV